MLIYILFCLASGVATAAFAKLFWGMPLWGAVLLGILVGVALRGLLSLVKRSLILSETIADTTPAEERSLETNRAIFWRRMLWIGIPLGVYVGITVGLLNQQFADSISSLFSLVFQGLGALVQILFLLVANFALFFGPFLLFGRMGRETVRPGDANFEVKIEDVRGQKAAVTEMKRILRLIEHGRQYVKAGGKRERGVLMVGPPGTGKTMLAKGIASDLKQPIVITSGASFQGMFLGMDMVNVWTMVRAAKKEARRWGGCIVFIDEFDALGQRRSGMGGAGGIPGIGGMFGGGQLGLNMLLVQMDGVDQPGFIKKGLRRFVNVTLDGLFVPRELPGRDGRRVSLRIPQLRAPRYNLFFIGATNRPSVLDEAVTRPGRFGRQLTFRIPTKEDRKDIADLYFEKKAHDPELDSPEKRDEFARITVGFSPAQIEQALSLALMYAFEDGRHAFGWKDLREALTNVSVGLAQPVVYSEREALAVARHEMGHAVAARFFCPELMDVRLSIRMRDDGSLGHHLAVSREEEFTAMRSRLAGGLRHALGALASERVFYGENSNGVTSDLMNATQRAATMIGVYGMGPDRIPPDMSARAVHFGEYLISVVEMTGGAQESGTVSGAVIRNPIARRTVAQVLGSAYMDCWRLMYVNKEAIDRGAHELVRQQELIGDEVTGLLDELGLRMFDEATPLPEEMPAVPRLEEPSFPSPALPAAH